MKTSEKWQGHLNEIERIEKEIHKLLENIKTNYDDIRPISTVLENISAELRIVKTRIFDKLNVVKVLETFK